MQLWGRWGTTREENAQRKKLELAAAQSQTLIVLSSEPDTIIFPSGEKATERILPLCALVFSLLSSRDDAARQWGTATEQMVGVGKCWSWLLYNPRL